MSSPPTRSPASSDSFTKVVMSVMTAGILGLVAMVLKLSEQQAVATYALVRIEEDVEGVGDRIDSLERRVLSLEQAE